MSMTKKECQGICKLDKNKVCIGCNRTIQEIESSGRKE